MLSLCNTRVATCLLFSLGIAGAQVYPGGGGSPYPGGQGRPYPGGGGGSPLPIPGRRGSQTKDSKKDPALPMPSFRGKLKRMDEKSIVLELGDNRVLDFKRTSKTKFFKAGEEIKSPKFNPGDQMSVEGPEEPGGYMTAVNVYWEKAASADTAEKD